MRKLNEQTDKFKTTYFQVGVELGWLVDPVNQEIYVFRRDRDNVVHAVTACLMKSWKPPATTQIAPLPSKSLRKSRTPSRHMTKGLIETPRPPILREVDIPPTCQLEYQNSSKRRTYYGAVSILAREFGPQMWLSRWARSLHTFQGDLFSPTFVQVTLSHSWDIASPTNASTTNRDSSYTQSRYRGHFLQNPTSQSEMQGWMQNTDNELMTSRSLDFLDPDLIRTSLSKTLFDALRIYRRNVQPQIGSWSRRWWHYLRALFVSAEMPSPSRVWTKLNMKRAQSSSSSRGGEPCFISFS